MAKERKKQPHVNISEKAAEILRVESEKPQGASRKKLASAAIIDKYGEK